MLSASTVLALAACGGGGGDGGSSNPPTGQQNPPPANVAPTATAGGDQTIKLPTNTLQLQGSATDDGLPTSSTLTYAWTVTTGTGVTFNDPASATATATFPAAGTYVLTLTVSDSALSGTDTVQVVVDPADPVALIYPAADTNETDPNRGWARVAPAEAGMDEAKLNEARDYAESGEGLGGAGFIARGGRLVYSWGDIDRRYEVKSTTKSIGGIALGLALHDNLLTLQTPAAQLLPSVGIQDPPQNPPPNEQWRTSLNILQLATHSAGFLKPNTAAGVLQYEPGTTWFYSDAGLTWLADVLTQAYGRDLRELLFERVYSRIGIAGPASTDDFVWANAVYRGATLNGVARRELHSGIGINTNSMARVGLLFLRKGVWANDERLLDESFVDLVQAPRPEVTGLANPDPLSEFPNGPQKYGVLWWTNKTGELQGVPTDAYWAWGLGDSLLVVIPSLDLVIARAGPQSFVNSTGRVWNDSNWSGEYDVLLPFLQPIVQSVSP